MVPVAAVHGEVAEHWPGMPLADGSWERGKCGYKSVQYMAAGLPVVASRVGASAGLVVEGETGILVSSHDEWVAALERLVADPALRRRWGEGGRRRAEEAYSLDVMAPRLIDLLGSVACPGPPGRQGASRGSLPGGSASLLPSWRKPPPA
jgi:glycosyltransferase involved in cell wall biosynthesis